MRKLLSIMLMGTCLCVSDAWAAPRRDCSYSPLQEVIRTARDEKEIESLIAQDVNFNFVPRCGGDALQLAVLRGNPTVLKSLLEKAKLSVDKTVSLADFPIEEAPREVPFLAFAAYYAPRADMMNLLLQVSQNMFVTDSRGENILWYLRRNPVLCHTTLYDEVEMKFLLNDTNKKAATEQTVDEKNAPKNQSKNNRQASPEPIQGQDTIVISGPEIVEPDRKFKPESQKDVIKSDF